MKQEKVSVKVLPDVRRAKGENRFPLKLRLTFKGQRRYYGTGFDASAEEWERINSDKASGDLRKIRIEISATEKKAILCIENIVPFSFKQFEKVFFDQKIRYETLKS